MRRLRIVFVLAIFMVWAVLITGRLVWLQVIRHAEWADKAQRQQERIPSWWLRGAAFSTTATCRSWR